MRDHVAKALTLIFTLLFQLSAIADEQVTQELNATWAKMSKAVAEGDLASYRAAFHPDAILVLGDKKTSYTIEKAFQRWQHDFAKTKSGQVTTRVDFRFSHRFHDNETAYEIGMFYFSTVDKEGNRKDHYVELEALLKKHAGKWLMMMEYQKAASTKEYWQKLS